MVGLDEKGVSASKPTFYSSTTRGFEGKGPSRNKLSSRSKDQKTAPSLQPWRKI
jgi:hypothetical protein